MKPTERQEEKTGPGSRSPAPPPGGAGITNILMVDDRPENLLAMEVVLEPLGQNLVRARSGQEALELIDQQEFAVILLDVQMPGWDGFETAFRIREKSRAVTTPIIFLTAASTDEKMLLRGYEQGAVDYIVKPFRPEVLRTKVKVFVDLQRKMAECRAARLELGQTNVELRRRVRDAEEASQGLKGEASLSTAFVSSLPFPAWIAGLDLHIQFSNPATARWGGGPETHVPGVSLEKAVGWEFFARALPHVESVLAGKGASRFESTLIHVRRGPRPVTADCVPILRDGKLVGIGIMAQELEDRR